MLDESTELTESIVRLKVVLIGDANGKNENSTFYISVTFSWKIIYMHSLLARYI